MMIHYKKCQEKQKQPTGGVVQNEQENTCAGVSF